MVNHQFERVRFENPNLSVDLGVGLWAWPLPMDYDEDGDYDLVVACPDVPYNGIYLFENKEGQVKFPRFEPAKKLVAGAKNYQVSYVNDAPRLMLPGVEYVDFRHFGLDQPEEIYPARRLERLHTKMRFSQWKYVDYEDDGDLDLLVGIDDWEAYGWDNAFDRKGRWTNGPLHGYVYWIENRNGKYYEAEQLTVAGKPIDVYGAPSPNLGDFDNDGDLDLICGEFLDRLTWFENIGSRESPKYASGRYLMNDKGILRMDLQMIIPTSIDWDRDGDLDLVVGEEDGRVAFLEHTGRVEEGMPIFMEPRYFQQKAQWLKFGALATPYSVDWDEDGDEDLLCGNTAGYIGFIENLGEKDSPHWAPARYLEVDGKPFRIMAGDSGSIQGPAEAKWGYTTLSVADWDNDGLLDIVYNSIWGRIEWLRNIGSVGNLSFAPPMPVQVNWTMQGDIPQPDWNWWNPSEGDLVTQWRTTPQALDWNKDGLVDLVCLDHEGYLAYYERYKDDQGAVALQPGRRIFEGVGGSQFDRHNSIMEVKEGPLRLNTGIAGKSGRRKWCFVDRDQDNDLDLLVNSENVAWFENLGERQGKVQYKFRGNLTDQKLAGHTTSPTVVDWNNNGIPDILIGAEDGHFYYLADL